MLLLSLPQQSTQAHRLRCQLQHVLHRTNLLAHYEALAVAAGKAPLLPLVRLRVWDLLHLARYPQPAP